MALPVVIPNTFANANASIPLSQLDNNFNTVAVAINGMANGAESLSNVNITGGAIGNVTLSNVSISSGNVTINVANVTTLDATNIEATNIKAKDGTAAATIADSTGKITVSTELAVDNLNLSGNAITSTDTNGNIDLTPNGTGEVNITKVDIDSGAIDGTAIGANSASTGAFTTLSATGVATFSAGTVGSPAITTSGDTNTGIFFPAADTIAFTEGGAEAMRLDASGNLGLGVTPSAWDTAIFRTIQIGSGAGSASVSGRTDNNPNAILASNVYYGAGAFRYVGTAAASYYNQQFGAHSWFIAGSGTAGNAISFTQAMTLDASGRLLIGTTTSGSATGVMQTVSNSSAAYTQWSKGNSGGGLVGAEGTGLWFYTYTGNIGSETYTERMRIDSSGNMLLGGTATPASATASLAIFNGTAPTGSVTNGIVLYAEDVSSSSELKVRDEAGNVTTLSPHNFSLIPDGPSEDMAWAYYSEKGGKRINVDMLKLARMVEKLTGEKLVYEN